MLPAWLLLPTAQQHASAAGAAWLLCRVRSAARQHLVRRHGRGWWLLRHGLHGLQVAHDLLKPGNVAHQEVAWGAGVGREGCGGGAVSNGRLVRNASWPGHRRRRQYGRASQSGHQAANQPVSSSERAEQCSPLTTLALGSATTTISSPSCCSMLRDEWLGRGETGRCVEMTCSCPMKACGGKRRQ